MAGDCRKGLISDRNLGAGRPNGVSSDCATGSHRFFQSYRGIGRRLAFDFRIELRAAEHDDRGHPHHEADGGSQRAIGGAVISEAGKIPGQQGRSGKSEQGGGDAPDAQPLSIREDRSQAYRQPDDERPRRLHPADVLATDSLGP
jgi:hypothetical protein